MKMAFYGNGYQGYQPNYGGYPQNYGGYPSAGQTMQQTVQTFPNVSYIPVRSEEEARKYPVAPGYTVTFLNEVAPILYKKSMGNSPLDRPIFEIYSVNKIYPPEDTQAAPESAVNALGDNYTSEIIRSEIKAIKGEIEGLKNYVNNLTAPIPTPAPTTARVAKKETKKDEQ